MSTPYIPTTDAALDAWAINFATKITANPGLYGLATADAAAIQAAVDAYDDAYQIAGLSGTAPKTPLNPATRTPVTVAAKDAARNAMLPIARFYAINIRNNVGVSNEDKTDLGITIVKTIPTPIPAPVTYPILSLISLNTNGATINVRDSDTPTVKRKPFGAIAAEAWITYAATPPVDPTAGDYIGPLTKSPAVVFPDPTKAGEQAWLYCRWITQRGLVGAFSTPLNFVVPNVGT